MLFGLLGPLQVIENGQKIAVPAAKQRVLLAALLVRPGQVLSSARLSELVWDGAPPRQSAATLRSYVMRLRQALGAAAGSRIVTVDSGYMVEATEDEIDITCFAALCQTGMAAVRAGAWGEAADLLAQAENLWRGVPLADIQCRELRASEVPRLELLRVQAIQCRIEASLRLGLSREVIPELRALTAEHPLKESFHAQLMLALYRTGSQADALAVYRDARRVFVDQLGIEPGNELRELHQRMLARDPALAVIETRAGGAVPRQLPPPVPHFVGRAGELETLTGLHDDPATPTVIISAIAGTAGVGKTALAVQWGHQVHRQFPDGQLYVNLRGYDPGEPLAPAEALAGFMRALGVAARDIPAATEERTAQYRSLLADRRMLILLDNAQSAEQVRPLLPGTPTCAVLVTSRDALAGLVARDGARRLDLDLLPLDEAVALLRTLIGERAVGSPEATHALAAHCARLPLALRIAAELVASRPSAPLSELVSELADTERPLDLLDAGGDDGTAVRAVFSWSYRHLPADAARAFRLLGLHPTANFDLFAAAALAGATADQAQHLVESLARAHLIQPLRPGWFTMHDLLRAYAAEVAAGHDAEPDRVQALTRLFDYYLRTASDAMDTLFPAERGHRPAVPAAVSDVQPVSEPGLAKEWLDAHRDILAAVAANMAAGWPGQADRLIAVLFRYLDDGGYFDHIGTGYRHAYQSARRRGDHAAESEALTGLGNAEWRLGRYTDARRHLEEALALYRQAGDRPGEARALGTLGNVVSQQGHYEQAADFYQQALNLYRQSGHLMGQGSTLGNLGDIDRRQGRYAEAAIHHQQALNLFRQAGNRTLEAYALNGLGEAVLWQGRYAEAHCHLQQALDLARQTGNRSCEPYVLAHLGELYLRLGRPQLAASYHREALERFRDIGDRSGEAEALSGLGDVLLATDQPRLALAEHDAALKLATLIGYRHQKARAHDGLARAHLATGDPTSARQQWQQALELYADLGTPEANQVRAQLASLASLGDTAIRAGRQFVTGQVRALDPSEITDLFSHVLTLLILSMYLMPCGRCGT